MVPENGKRILNWIGTLLSAISIVFVVVKLQRYSGELSLGGQRNSDLVLYVLFSMIYGGSGILLAAAWCNILTHLGIPSDFKRDLRIYGLSQVSKYIPGNVFQFLGRQALGLKYGLPGWPLARSAFLEIAVLAISGALFISFALPLFWQRIQPVHAVVIFLAISALVIGSIYWMSGRFLARALFLDTFFLLVSGGLFTAVLYLVEPEALNLGMGFLWVICGSFVIAWLLGFLTPGAPAGVGIREVVLLWLLGSVVQEPTLLSAVVISRMVTVLGDVLFFGCVLLIKTKNYQDA
jgi:hypothetical protein